MQTVLHKLFFTTCKLPLPSTSKEKKPFSYYKQQYDARLFGNFFILLNHRFSKKKKIRTKYNGFWQLFDVGSFYKTNIIINNNR